MSKSDPLAPRLSELAQSELSDLDLLSEQTKVQLNDHLKTQVFSATDAFQVRFQRSQKHLEQSTNEQRRARRHNSALLLQALASLRRSLRSVCRLEFDADHRLRLIEDDWQGWPRLSLRLINSQHLDREFLPLRIIAQNSIDVSLIEISTPSELTPAIIPISSEADFIKLTSIFRKSIRQFLDNMGEILIAEKLAFQDSPLPVRGSTLSESHSILQSGKNLSTDLFSEDLYTTSSLEALPSISEVQMLAVGPLQHLKK